MKVGFADTFLPSLKKMIQRERWYWKTWDFLRYDMPRFFSNIWLFRKALYRFRWYSGQHAVLPFMETAVTEMSSKIESRGNEMKTSADKKVVKMKRASEIMKIFIEDDFIKLAENELGEIIHHDWVFEPVEGKEGFSQIKDQDTEEEKVHNSKVFKRSREIEEQMWSELWEIFKGQDTSKFKEAPEDIADDHDKSYDYWQDQFDGSGMRSWWD